MGLVVTPWGAHGYHTTLMHTIVLFLMVIHITHVAAVQLYPAHGVTAFQAYSNAQCKGNAIDPGTYRGRIYRMLAPRLEVCYKCGGKAIRWENLNPHPAGNIRQCINLGNDCTGSFSCTDITPGACVSHPCISGSSVFGLWFNQLFRGYHVQPYVDTSCSNTASLPPPYHYLDMNGHCLVFDNTTSITPLDPRCTSWTSTGSGSGNARKVNVCTAPEKLCNNTSGANDPVQCDSANGAGCVLFDVDNTTCASGAGWPFLGDPGVTVAFVDGNLAPGFAAAFRLSVGRMAMVLAVLLWTLLFV